MAIAVPIPLPLATPPDAARLRGSPNNLDELWDAASLSIKRDELITVNLNAYTEDLTVNTAGEIRPGAIIRTLPASPQSVFLTSDNASDLHPVLLEYLDGDKLYRLGIVNLTGTTPVEIENLFRIISIQNSTSDAAEALLLGAGETYNGGVSVGTVSAYISPGTGDPTEATTQAHYSADIDVNGDTIALERSLESGVTIPAGYRGLVKRINLLVGRADEVFVAVQSRAPGGIWITFIPFQLSEGAHEKNMSSHAIPELHDIRAIAIETMAVAGVPVTFSYQVLLVKNGET